MSSESLTELQRWKCICAYDGGGFSGWQSQTDGTGVQDAIERRLKTIFGLETRIHGSGRTDAGVHALAQVFHFDSAWRHGPGKLLAAMRTGLPQTIQVKSTRAVARGFHSRFDATGKVYFYRIHHGGFADPFENRYCWSIPAKLNVAAMRAGARQLVGKHDFKAFAAINGVERETTVRNLRRLEVTERGLDLRITAEADGFLYKMVRSLVGGLVAAGEGKLTPDALGAILCGARRTHVVQTAPAQGLFLAKVFY